MKTLTTFQPSEIIASLPWYERAIEAIAPDYANRRLVARLQRHAFRYNAAQSDRLYAPKTNGYHAESTSTARDRVTMGWEALDLIQNFVFAKSAIRKYSTFLTPNEYAPATGDRAYDGMVAEYFHDWCKRADAKGVHAFSELIQLACEMRPGWGDCGFVVRKKGKEIRLELVGGERIGSPHEIYGASAPNYVSGIVVNDHGVPQAYRVFRIDPFSNQWTDPEDIPAARFLHYFDPFRADQMRGVTDFHAALRPARMLKEILDAEQVGVRHASQQVALVFNERGQAPSRNAFTPSGASVLPNGNMPKEEYSEAGKIQYLQHGDRVETMPSRPSSAFQGFVDEVKSEIALGLGSYPPGVLWGTADYKGPSVRAEFAQADRANARGQRILENRVLRRVPEMVVLNAIANGDIPPPPMKSGEGAGQAIIRATRGSFRFPPRLTIDVGRETQARLSELSMGATSPQEIAAEDGKDAYVRAEEKAQFAQFSKELSVKYGVPETSIFLPAGQQLPNTPAMAASVGENAGAAAAQSQADSVPKLKPAEMSVEAALNGPRSAKRVEIDATSRRMGRLFSLKARMAGAKSDASKSCEEFKRISL